MFSNKINLIKWSYFFLFIALSLFTIYHHEFWADEIQAFLIAKTENFSNIISVIPHQEAQPILWHIILKLLIITIGDTPSVLFVSILFMSISVWIILFKLDIPLMYKLLIPFGYNFIYQYNIVSRNYCLAYLSLTIVALLYPNRHKYIWSYTLSLLFLAYSTIFYAPIAFILGIYWFIEGEHKKKYIFPLIMLTIFGILYLWQIFPITSLLTKYRLFNTNINSIYFLLSPILWKENIYLSLFFSFYLYYALCIELGKNTHKINVYNLILSLCLWISFFIIFAVSSATFHHEGLIFGLFLFNLYITPVNWSKVSYYFLINVLILHIYWGGESIIYDIKNEVTPFKSVYTLLKDKELLNKKLHLIGYQNLPIFEFIDKEHTTLSKNEQIYATWQSNDPNLFDNYKKRISSKHDIVIFDIIAYIYYFTNKNEFSEESFDKHEFKAALPYKDGLSFDQTCIVYIKKKIYKP